MHLSQAILTILLTIQPYYGDVESAKDRKDRLTIVADAIDQVATYGACEEDDEECENSSLKLYNGTKLDLAAILLTTGRFESAFAKHVHENKCRLKIGECDGGRAKSPWQIQYTPLTRDFWKSYKGADSESTSSAAWAAGTILTRGYANCGSWRGAIAQYATGKGCVWKPQQMRYDYYLKVRKQIADLLEQDDD